GFIVINVSNRYLNLRPVVAAAAKALGMQAYVKVSKSGSIGKMPFFQAEFMVLTDQPAQGGFLKARGWTAAEPRPDFRLWTDQYSNITSLFKLKLLSQTGGK